MPNPSPLGDFLRSRRARLSPKDVGLPERARRRTPGLRRDEVAARAGISVEWYVKLEQGRARAPSPETLTALAGALSLSDAEAQHLLRLGRGEQRAPFRPETVPPALETFVRGLAQPAWLIGLRWDILYWNAAAQALFGDLLDVPEGRPNQLYLMMTDPRARTLFGEGWEHEARRMLSQFRATHDKWPNDPAFATLIEEIRAAASEFDPWWREHDVGAAASGRKILNLPGHGPREFAYLSFQSNDDADLRLSILNPC